MDVIWFQLKPEVSISLRLCNTLDWIEYHTRTNNCIGQGIAKTLDGLEVVVTTHSCCEHGHNYFVDHSVNCETGYKIQINEKS